MSIFPAAWIKINHFTLHYAEAFSLKSSLIIQRRVPPPPTNPINHSIQFPLFQNGYINHWITIIKESIPFLTLERNLAKWVFSEIWKGITFHNKNTERLKHVRGWNWFLIYIRGNTKTYWYLISKHFFFLVFQSLYKHK